MNIKNRLNSFLRKFGVEIHGLNYLHALAKNDFKSDEMDIIEKVFKAKNLTIYDVGANRGLMTRKFLQYFPQASIHLFEPYRPFYDNLLNDFKFQKNITVNNYGITDHDGHSVFNINKSIDTSSFLNSQLTGLNSDQQVKTISKVTVEVTTIDKYAANYGHDRINILKLDIQGSELNALKGAAELLRDKKIDLIFCETYFIQQYQNQPSFFEISNYLLQYGYILQDIYHPIYGKGKLAWCDSIYIRNDLIFE